MPFEWRIVIADNASTDQTPQIAAALANDLQGVSTLALAQKGRGRALRVAWLGSDAEVACYMDVHLRKRARPGCNRREEVACVVTGPGFVGPVHN